MKILILGGTGAMGTYLVQILKQRIANYMLLREHFTRAKK